MYSKSKLSQPQTRYQSQWRANCFASSMTFNTNRKVSLTTCSLGKAAATSGARRTMFVPAAYCSAYFPRTPFFQGCFVVLSPQFVTRYSYVRHFCTFYSLDNLVTCVPSHISLGVSEEFDFAVTIDTFNGCNHSYSFLLLSFNTDRKASLTAFSLGKAAANIWRKTDSVCTRTASTSLPNGQVNSPGGETSAF